MIIKYRVDSKNPAHTVVSVFTGEKKGALAKNGVLTFRRTEWERFRFTLEDMRAHSMHEIQIDEEA